MIRILLFSFAVTALLSSCDASPMPEINIVGEIPANRDFGRDSLQAFVRRFANQSGLKLVYENPATGNLAMEGEFLANLKPDGHEQILVSVLARLSERRLTVSVTDGVDPARAEQIIIQATALIQDIFPGTSVKRFERKRGLLGP
jgi:hypothetical protein